MNYLIYSVYVIFVFSFSYQFHHLFQYKKKKNNILISRNVVENHLTKALSMAILNAFVAVASVLVTFILS